MSRRFPPLLIALVSYLLLASLFFYPFFQGKVIFYIDNLLHIAPAYTFWKEEILAGSLPLWNPYIFAGMPFLADPSHPVFSPFNLIYLIMSNIFQAITLQAILLVAGAGLGAYFLARSFKLQQFASWWVGLSYAFSGMVLEGSSDINTLTALVLLPWVLGLFLSEVIQKRRFFSWRLALGIALYLLLAHTQYVFYALLLMGIGVVWQTITEKKKTVQKLIGFVLTLGLVGGLGAIQLFPSWELAQRTQRSENFTRSELPVDLSGIRPVQIATILFPTIYGSLTQGNSWGPGSQMEQGLATTILFVSLPTLILAVLGGFKVTQQWRCLTFCLWGGVLGALMLGFGANLPFFPIIYRFIPGFTLFRSPQRILVLYVLGLATLSGLGLQSLKFFSKSALFRRLNQIGWIVGGALLILMATYMVKPDILAFPFAQAYFLIKHTSISSSLSYPWPKVAAISRLFLENSILFMIGLLAFLGIVAFFKTKKMYYFGLAVGLSVVELFLGIRGNILFTRPRHLVVKPDMVNFLRQTLEHQRFVSVSEIQPYLGIWSYFNHLIVRPPFSQEKVTDEELRNWSFLEKEVNQLPSNLPQMYKLANASGYTALLPKAYRDFAGSSRVNHLNFRNYDNPTLAELATKYLIVDQSNDPLAEDKHYQKVFSSQEAIVYQNVSARPRAEFLIAGQAKPAKIIFVKDDPNRVVLEIETETKGDLVLRDFLYPGWEVSVNSLKKEIKPFQQIFRSVPLDAGKSRVDFSYHPKSFYNGARISLVSLVIVVLRAALEKRRTTK